MLSRHFLAVVLAVFSLVGCRIDIAVPEGGIVVTESRALMCAQSTQCSMEVHDTAFNETFVAIPDTGFLFSGWVKQHLALCGGSLDSCQLDASLAADSPTFTALIDSDAVVYLQAQFLPADQIRRYEHGDVTHFEGSLVASTSDFPANDGPVEASLTIAATTLSQNGFAVFEGRLQLFSLDGRPLLDASVQFWQDDKGGINLLTDESGNVFLDTASNTQGIALVPSPLVPFTQIDVLYSAMWGGHTSTPLTDGALSIGVSEEFQASVPAGDFPASAITVLAEYSYLVSFDDYKKGQSVNSELTLNVSKVKGIVHLDIDRRLYSDRGELLDTLKLSLDAVGFSY